jgi:hypothetical protein
MNEHTDPEFEGQLRDLLAAPEADAAFVSGLRYRLMAGIGKKPMRRWSIRLAWGCAIALALLAIGLLPFSPQAVRAMRRLLAYIPGVGFVETGPALRVLPAPVTFTKDGLTLTIEQGAADLQRTVLLARVAGYTQPSTGAPTCTEPLQLVAADGTVLEATEIAGSSNDRNPGILFVRYTFQPMPAGALDATLEIPCLMFDANYPGWLIPLHFVFAGGADQVFPVIELPTPLTPQSIRPGAPAPSSESAPADFSILLTGAAELEDGFLLSGSYRWSDPRIDRYAVAISHSLIVDANGQDVPYMEVEPDSSANPGPQEIPFAYQITGKDFAWPLSLIVNSISVVQPGLGVFEFDPGTDPQVGQSWDVNIDVPVGQHVIHVRRIELKGGPPGVPETRGFEFTMTSDPAVASAFVQDTHPIINCTGGCGGGGGGGGGGGDFGVSGFDGAAVPFVHGWAMQGYVPAGPKTFAISDVAVFFHGPWQVSWQP